MVLDLFRKYNMYTLCKGYIMDTKVYVYILKTHIDESSQVQSGPRAVQLDGALHGTGSTSGCDFTFMVMNVANNKCSMVSVLGKFRFC